MNQHRPAPPLSAWVECLWEVERGAGPPGLQGNLPGGTADLIFNLGDAPKAGWSEFAGSDRWSFRDAHVSGVYAQRYLVETGARSHVIGVHLRPGGARPLLGVPLHEIADRHVALDAIWGSAVASLRQRLLDAPDAYTRFALLQADLLQRLLRAPPVRPVVSFALRRLAAQPHEARVDAVKRASGLGDKRFIALFRDAVGLAPKRFARVRRFHALLHQLAQETAPDWARLAADMGYADQSHLHRDFLAFAGTTPGRFRPWPGRVGHARPEERNLQSPHAPRRHHRNAPDGALPEHRS